MRRKRSDVEKIFALLESDKVRVLLVWKLPFGLEDCWGYCDEGNDGEILIKRTLCLNSKILILIHECLHWLYPKRNHSWIWPQSHKIYGMIHEQYHERFVRLFENIEKIQIQEHKIQKQREERCRKRKRVSKK